MGLRRRSFFGAAAAGSAALFAPPSASADARSPSSIRTAVTVLAQLQWPDQPTDLGIVACPDGFVPVAICCEQFDVSLRLYDDEGDVMRIHAYAFRHGPIDLWRPVVGALRMELTNVDHRAGYLGRPVVTIYGEIDID